MTEGNGPTLSTTNFTALGPKPVRMTGCSGCFDYTTTEGRVNDIVIDPTTTTNGSIVAYAGTVGGGVWKTTNCCSAATTWSAVTDDPLISTIAIDTFTIDPNNHNTIYAGTGDLNFGSFSMGSQGILKSTDAGATWTVLGADVFGPPTRCRPASSRNTRRSAKCGSTRTTATTSWPARRRVSTSRMMRVSNWTGPCTTNSFNTKRQDITGLELSISAAARASLPRSACAALPPPCNTTSIRTARTVSTRHDAGQRLPDLHFHRHQRQWLCLRHGRNWQPLYHRREHECRQRRSL